MGNQSITHVSNSERKEKEKPEMRRLEKRRSISGVGFLTEIQEKESTGTPKK